jgi:hypothetical protein
VLAVFVCVCVCGKTVPFERISLLVSQYGHMYLGMGISVPVCENTGAFVHLIHPFTDYFEVPLHRFI